MSVARLQSQHSRVVSPAGSPFDLANPRAYAAWRERKLAQYPQSLAALRVRVANPRSLSKSECAAIRAACERANMAIYASAPRPEAELTDTSLVAELGRQFGLQRLDRNLYADDDGISALQVSRQPRKHDYIPYSSKGISWHTDGYYNPPERTIRAMVLHCARPAADGGENALLDHEMLYLQLRDENPNHIHALMQADVMTIPANIEEGVEIRPAQSGPVFSVDAGSGRLHMRYTARTRSIVWKDDAATRAAVKALEALLGGDSAYVFHARLAAGEGIISNNVLHTRTAFVDSEGARAGRLIFRARYYDYVQ